ncbi:hypothetical protein LTR09_002181 [Extremus antarcticus]|uniref:BTB domain-containing protein n=1 Tax=Extremus antarcticus TaxID=702011 RepID=A0AAJ0GGL5_9PEZI|nr:hypothetical protein LTR09_002181 [Extremus antarcticus]
MAPTIDAQDCFNQAKHSDITIKSGTRKFKCHKIILAKASEYFAKLIDPDSGWIEQRQSVIELKEDDTEAVEAMLRYIYSFEYEAIVSGEKARATPQFHLNVYTTAHKYRLSTLMNKATASLDKALVTINTTAAGTNGGSVPEDVFELVKLLSAHGHYSTNFVAKSDWLVKRHLPVLIKLKAFRQWLDEGNKSALALVFDAVATGCAEKPPVKETTHEIRVCRSCRLIFFDNQCANGHFCTSLNRQVSAGGTSDTGRVSYKAGVLTSLRT